VVRFRLGDDAEDWAVYAGWLIRDLVDSYSGHLRRGRSFPYVQTGGTAFRAFRDFSRYLM
jgi:hypothetical protein